MFFGNFGAPIVESFENDETKNDTCSEAIKLAAKVCKKEEVEEAVSTENVEEEEKDDHENFDNGEEEFDTEDGEEEEEVDGSEVEDKEEENEEVEVEEDEEDKEEENEEVEEDEEEGLEPFTVEGFKNNNNSCFLCLNTDQLLRSVLYGCLFFILSHPQTHSRLFKMLKGVPKKYNVFIPALLFMVAYYVINMFV